MLLKDSRTNHLSACAGGEGADGADGLLVTSEENTDSAVPFHPLRIKPLGNAYTSSRNIKSAAGFFSILPDEIIIQVVELLQAASLLRLGATCKALYAFCHFDELWKPLFLGYVAFQQLGVSRNFYFWFMELLR